MRTICVNTAPSYEILIENGCFPRIGELVKPVVRGTSAVIVTDSNIGPLYAKQAADSLGKSGFDPHIFTFPAGEPNKTLATVGEILGFFAQKRLTRADFAVALGGGVTGDLTGFAASIYLRGIDFVQVPTSLLAQVDSSVGGKTGCDLPQGKNLVGAFWQPRAVVIDPEVNQTLPPLERKSGMAEVIKTAAIKDAEWFDQIGTLPDIELIARSVDIKRGVVERDERESGERMLLNFGHTVGHALEKAYNFTGITHGEAVAVGMAAALRVGERLGMTPAGVSEKLTRLLTQYDLPVSTTVPMDQLIPHIAGDKKRQGDCINFVVLEAIGRARTLKIELTELAGLLKL